MAILILRNIYNQAIKKKNIKKKKKKLKLADISLIFKKDDPK